MRVSLTENKDYIVVEEASKLEQKQLEISFRKKIKNHWVNPKVRAGVWDGSFNFFERGKFISSGLWKELIDVCDKFNHPINKSFINDLIDSDIKKSDVESFFDDYFENSKITPRYYQIEAVYKFVKYKRMISEIATSAGKTLIIFMIFVYLKHLYALDGIDDFKMLMVVPNTSLVIQGYEDFQEYSEGTDFKMMMVSGETGNHSKKKLDDYDIVVGTYQSLVKKNTKFISRFDAVMVDECHIVAAASLKKILTKSISADYKMGLSGTTGVGNHAEGFTIQQHLGPLIYKISPTELIEGNYATPVHVSVFELDYTTMKNKKNLRELSNRKNYDKRKLLKLEKKLAATDPRRLHFIIKLIEKSNKNSLVLFSSVEAGYGKKIFDTLRSRNNDREILYVDGGTHADVRESHKAKMEEKDNIVLVASFGTFSTGISIKNLHNVYLVESYKSEKIIKQSIGRGMRLLQDKKKVNIIDIVDDFRVSKKSKANYLYRHGLERREIYNREEFPVKVYKFNLTKKKTPKETKKSKRVNKKLL